MRLQPTNKVSRIGRKANTRRDQSFILFGSVQSVIGLFSRADELVNLLTMN